MAANKASSKPAPAELPRCICIAGPTASGKTAAALAIAQRWPVEIISVDSALVYRSMDIGTAKPSAAELAAVPHHLIDIRDPLQAYSAAEFATDAKLLLNQITERGKIPLLVGGTMLYFKALFEGLDDMPRADPAIRAALELEAAQVGWPAMHAQLAQVDPVSAARLQPNDAQRVQRALEVFRISGKPLSSFQLTNQRLDQQNDELKEQVQNAINNIATEAINTPAIGQNGTKNTLFISLEPENRAWLHERIAQRFDLMLSGGFEAEVRRLRARGDLTVDTPSIRCVGYRQMWEALDEAGSAALGAGLSPKLQQDMRDKGIAATRQLAKRQLTWLRSNPERHIVPCDAPNALEQVLAAVADWFNQVKT